MTRSDTSLGQNCDFLNNRRHGDVRQAGEHGFAFGLGLEGLHDWSGQSCRSSGFGIIDGRAGRIVFKVATGVLVFSGVAIPDSFRRSTLDAKDTVPRANKSTRTYYKRPT